MKTPAILEKIQKIPTKTRAIAFGVVTALVTILFIWQVHIPKTSEIGKLDTEIAGLEATMRDNDAKIKKLDMLKAKVKELQEKLKVLTKQLPPESEVSGLLREIQNLVNKAGLTLKLWKPDKRKPGCSGMCEEIPISLKLLGGYHNVAMFYDSVSKLTRIVNIANVKMGGAKVGNSGLMEIEIDCTAMTFAATEKKMEEKTAVPVAVKQVK
ncbi:MAG: type 4a pilus biogenesis protein PilO [Nitrospirota bacterium]|nr:type 4a pilus biogenesis protein PilO [Nitrospirota bacterium]